MIFFVHISRIISSSWFQFQGEHLFNFTLMVSEHVASLLLHVHVPSLLCSAVIVCVCECMCLAISDLIMSKCPTGISKRSCTYFLYFYVYQYMFLFFLSSLCVNCFPYLRCHNACAFAGCSFIGLRRMKGRPDLLAKKFLQKVSCFIFCLDTCGGNYGVLHLLLLITYCFVDDGNIRTRTKFSNVSTQRYESCVTS